MGGLGSTRWKGHKKKTQIEACACLAVWDFGIDVLVPYADRWGRWIWDPGDTPRASLFFRLVTTAEVGTLRIHVAPDSEMPSEDQVVRLSSIPRCFGGREWYFHCPQCDRRVAKLYLPPHETHYACRTCHDLTYRARQQHDKGQDPYKARWIEELEALLRGEELPPRERERIESELAYREAAVRRRDGRVTVFTGFTTAFPES
jgi:hypothetical protein